jgi:hypothetical protein
MSIYQPTNQPTNHLPTYTEQSPFWEVNNPSASQEIPRYMEPEKSLSYSRDPATCPCHEPNASFPSFPSSFPEIHSNAIL